MNIDEIIRLIEAANKNGLTSFSYEEGNQKLVIKKKTAKQPVPPVVISQPAQPLLSSLPYAGGPAAPAEAPQKTEETEETVPDIGASRVVTSPLVGTFYSSPSPEKAPFVQAGDTVKKGQTLGIVEAMKLMNEIESDFDGIVEAVLVSDEDMVEYGQPLFRIR